MGKNRESRSSLSSSYSLEDIKNGKLRASAILYEYYRRDSEKKRNSNKRKKKKVNANKKRRRTIPWRRRTSKLKSSSVSVSNSVRLKNASKKSSSVKTIEQLKEKIFERGRKLKKKEQQNAVLMEQCTAQLSALNKAKIDQKEIAKLKAELKQNKDLMKQYIEKNALLETFSKRIEDLESKSSAKDEHIADLKRENAEKDKIMSTQFSLKQELCQHIEAYKKTIDGLHNEKSKLLKKQKKQIAKDNAETLMTKIKNEAGKNEMERLQKEIAAKNALLDKYTIIPQEMAKKVNKQKERMVELEETIADLNRRMRQSNDKKMIDELPPKNEEIHEIESFAIQLNQQNGLQKDAKLDNGKKEYIKGKKMRRAMMFLALYLMTMLIIAIVWKLSNSLTNASVLNKLNPFKKKEEQNTLFSVLFSYSKRLTRPIAMAGFAVFCVYFLDQSKKWLRHSKRTSI